MGHLMQLTPTLNIFYAAPCERGWQVFSPWSNPLLPFPPSESSSSKPGLKNFRAGVDLRLGMKFRCNLHENVQVAWPPQLQQG